MNAIHQLRNVDTSRILGQLLSSGTAAGVAGALAGGVLASKRGRKLGKKAAEIGGLAAVAGLAWLAYERYRSGAARAEPARPLASDLVLGAVRGGFLPASSEAAPSHELGLTLLRAMIAAASADGKLEGPEGEAIFRAVDRYALDGGEKALLLQELGRPVGIDDLAAAAKTPEIAAEIYEAALLAIEVDTPGERAWLSQLASRLGLPDPLVAQLEARVESELDSSRAPA